MPIDKLRTTVRNGLPVEVSYSVQPAEPDIGIFCRYVEIDNVEVLSRKTGKYRSARWLEKAMSIDDWYKLECECLLSSGLTGIASRSKMLLSTEGLSK
jgi:hypothetical protein